MSLNKIISATQKTSSAVSFITNSVDTTQTTSTTSTTTTAGTAPQLTSIVSQSCSVVPLHLIDSRLHASDSAFNPAKKGASLKEKSLVKVIPDEPLMLIMEFIGYDLGFTKDSPIIAKDFIRLIRLIRGRARENLLIAAKNSKILEIVPHCFLTSPEESIAIPPPDLRECVGDLRHLNHFIRTRALKMGIPLKDIKTGRPKNLARLIDEIEKKEKKNYIPFFEKILEFFGNLNFN